MKLALRLVRANYSRTPVADFGPLALNAVRQAMIAAGWCRSYTNHQVNHIRRAFKWGVENELVPPSVLQALQAVAPLRYGRTEARETEPVRPVPDVYVDAVLPVVSRQVAGTNNESERTLRGPALARKIGRTNKTIRGVRRQTVVVSVLESLRQHLSQFTLSSIAPEVLAWCDAGQSGYVRLLTKMRLSTSTSKTTLLDRLLSLRERLTVAAKPPLMEATANSRKTNQSHTGQCSSTASLPGKSLRVERTATETVTLGGEQVARGWRGTETGRRGSDEDYA